MSNLTRRSFRLPVDDYEKISLLVAEGEYRDFSTFVRDACYLLLGNTPPEISSKDLKEKAQFHFQRFLYFTNKCLKEEDVS